MDVETRYFLIFQNILGTTKNFRNRRDLFQILLSSIFYKKSDTFSEIFLTWSFLTNDIFWKKNWLLCSDKCQVQKGGDVIACFFCTIKKKKKFKSSQADSWDPRPPPFIKGVEFSKFLQKRRGSGFSHKKGEVGKIGSILKTGVSFVFILTNSIQCYLFLSVWCVCVCFAYLHHFYQYFLCFTGII